MITFFSKDRSYSRAGSEPARPYHKNGQVTIFIIVGILIVVSIIILFLFYGKSILQSPQKQDTQGYISDCARKAVAPSIEKALANAGLMSPVLKIPYGGENYTYLCYQKNFYLTCTNQVPLLKNRIEQELTQDSENRIKMCFDSLKKELENQHYTVTEGDLSYSVEIAPHEVILHINKQVEVSKEGSQSFSNFDTRVMSPLYDLSNVAHEIVNQESQYCNFEYNGFMLLYPEYDIKRISYIDSRIYIVKERTSGKEFKFAVRSCAFPPGL